MPSQQLNALIEELGLSIVSSEASESTLARIIALEIDESIAITGPLKLVRHAFLFERLGVEAHWESRSSSVTTSERDRRDELRQLSREGFHKAYQCWRALVYANGDEPSVPGDATDLISAEFPRNRVSPYEFLAFHLGICGLVSQRVAEVRLELKKFQLATRLDATWDGHVLEAIFDSMVRLIRKANGWVDVRSAIGTIERLREEQARLESDYVSQTGDEETQLRAAIELVSFYHLAQMVSLTAGYIEIGEPSKTTMDARIDQHRSSALNALKTIHSVEDEHLVDLASIACGELIQNSIWTHSASLASPVVRRFMRGLTEEGRSAPILELWPAQQEALRRNVLSTYHRAILVEMPTSAGKTLLAKLAIVQSKALDPDSVVAYVVPSRALVNQVTRELRQDFAGLQPQIIVEQSVPVCQLDPTESALLSNPPDVLVTTPEKLDLLIRKGHPSVRQLGLVIADEAHHVSDLGRGARLELLLATIKRDYAGSRFLLLSPFLPNDDELLHWLGDEQALPPIAVKWRPNNRIVGTTTLRGRLRNRRLRFETVPAAGNSDINRDLSISIGHADLVDEPRTKAKLSLATALSLSNRGAVLILCEGRGTASKRAAQLAAIQPELARTDEVAAVCHYLETEVGVRTTLIDCLERGVAFHHAGLSHEARWLIEWLVRIGSVKFVCGTTTLAEGVNFPISTVIVETLHKGNADLEYTDFWNIAGRAGRSLVDNVGVVAFPSVNTQYRNRIIEFLRKEAEEVVSQLSNLISRADEISQQFSLSMVMQNPGLSELLQYLAHAMKVSEREDLAQEVEDILRSSLVYHQLRRRSQFDAERLVGICRSYLRDLSRSRQVRGILGLADQTGFATPSVMSLLARKAESPSLANVADWSPSILFGRNNEYLTERISAIAELPEIRLGPGRSRPFNPSLVAEVLRAWVQGESLQTLAANYPHTEGNNAEQNLSDFSSYLFSKLITQASWGLGALETVCLERASDEDWQTVGYVPSMVYFGVKTKEAVWLRMVGVPRPLAGNLAELWSQQGGQTPQTYNDLRDWITNLGDSDWQRSIPRRSRLTVSDCRLLWSQLSGVPSHP